jgi:CarD family transcriptional regulator
MRMLKAIHAHEQDLPSGKNLPMSDLELMRSAERQLYNEFCFVLDIRKEQVLPFILGQCRVEAKKPTAS